MSGEGYLINKHVKQGHCLNLAQVTATNGEQLFRYAFFELGSSLEIPQAQ